MKALCEKTSVDKLLVRYIVDNKWQTWLDAMQMEQTNHNSTSAMQVDSLREDPKDPSNDNPTPAKPDKSDGCESDGNYFYNIIKNFLISLEIFIIL